VGSLRAAPFCCVNAEFFYQDPSAPAPNRPIGVGVLALIEDASGAVLLERRSDCGRWGLPGGAVEPHEALEDALRREVLEETGLVVSRLSLLCISVDPSRRVRYPDGNVVRLLTFAYLAEVEYTGSLRKSEESLEVRFVPREVLGGLDVIETARPILERFLSDEPAAGLLLS
jgi:ADP-ribose pyrophosphatase YjhB (NUDIX family)